MLALVKDNDSRESRIEKAAGIFTFYRVSFVIMNLKLCRRGESVSHLSKYWKNQVSTGKTKRSKFLGCCISVKKGHIEVYK